jgi:hypothetical protein
MTTLFNPLRGQHYGPWRLAHAFRRSVWRVFFQNLRYELIDKWRWRR